jgi:hypothetical protein
MNYCAKPLIEINFFNINIKKPGNSYTTILLTIGSLLNASKFLSDYVLK